MYSPESVIQAMKEAAGKEKVAEGNSLDLKEANKKWCLSTFGWRTKWMFSPIMNPMHYVYFARQVVGMYQQINEKSMNETRGQSNAM